MLIWRLVSIIMEPTTIAAHAQSVAAQTWNLHMTGIILISDSQENRTSFVPSLSARSKLSISGVSQNSSLPPTPPRAFVDEPFRSIASD